MEINDEGIFTGVFLNQDTYKYKCPNGHTYISQGIDEPFHIDFTSGDVTKRVNCCLFCLADWIEKNIPKLEKEVEKC